MSDTAKIEALWIEPGTPHDAAAAANMHRAPDNRLDARDILEIWDRAKAEGRLPPFWRPWKGFKPDHVVILRRFMMIGMGRAA